MKSPNDPLFIKSRAKTLAVTGLVLFAISTIFPIVAGIVTIDLLPKWVGPLDGILAFTLVAFMIFIQAWTPGKFSPEVREFSFRIYRVLANILIVLLLAFFIFGNQVIWEVLLPGLAWRTWVLVYFLPHVLTLWKSG